MPQLPLSYNSPLEAVFLRTLAWEIYVANEKLTMQHVTKGEVQAARRELGLLPSLGGAADDFIQKLRVKLKPTLSPAHTPPEPTEKGWRKEWRLHYLPPHNLVRQLSDRPILETIGASAGPSPHSEFLITLRDPALPTVHVFTGAQAPSRKIFGGHRGLYFLRTTEQLYLGKTDEFDVRLFQHYTNHQRNSDPVLWWVFVSP